MGSDGERPWKVALGCCVALLLLGAAAYARAEFQDYDAEPWEAAAGVVGLLVLIGVCIAAVPAWLRMEDRIDDWWERQKQRRRRSRTRP